MASMLLGERLTNLMELQNTNNKQVCESLHIHPSTFSGYLSGKRQPSYDILMRMAAYFHTTCDYLLGYTPPQNNASDLTDDTLALLHACGQLPPEGQEMLWEEIKLIVRLYHRQD